MTGLPPEVSVLLIGFGLVLALVCYLLTNLSPGGMITPGWLALVFVVQPLLALIIGAVVLITYVLCRALQEVVILYGKRLFATVVLIAVFFQITFFMFFVNSSALFFDVTTLGFIVPGLVTYQLLRQPPVATLAATATVTMVAYAVMLGGILMGLVPIEARNAAAGRIATEPAASFSSLHLIISAVGMALVLVIVGTQARRMRGAPMGATAALVVADPPRLPTYAEADEPLPGRSDGDRTPIPALAQAEAQG